LLEGQEGKRVEPTEAPAQTRGAAGRWQREHAQSLKEWRESGASLAAPQLTTLCRAVNETARELSSNLHALGAELPPTRTCCNDLCFRDYDEAAAYMVQHLTDRYGRVTQVLGSLFAAGHLPLRRRRMSVLEVGAGPAPGLYATRDFYADLALWAEATGQQTEFVPVTYMHALDRGEAWGRLLHHLSERLVSLRSVLPSSPGALPFRVEYDNLAGFSPIREHITALDHTAAVISADFDRADEPISPTIARRFAEEDGVDKPSAYDLVLMCNFLTTEDSVEDFRADLRQLASSLTPGGLLIVIGAPDWGKKGKYARIWSELRALVRDAGLTELRGFEKPIPANQKQEWATVIRQQRQEILDELRGIDALPAEAAGLRATDTFMPFQALIWKNQRPARRGPRRRQATPRRPVTEADPAGHTLKSPLKAGSCPPGRLPQR
jgi:SAM-dependent methyltransferase